MKWYFTTQYAISESGIYPNVNFARASGATPLADIGPAGLASADRQRFENLYNDLFGRVSSIATTFYGDSEKFQAAGSPRTRNFFFHDYSYYFQDDWRVTPTFTFNLGLRWDFFGVPFERDKLQGIVKQAGLVNTVSQIADLTVERSTKYYGNDWNNFAPRFGFAWAPRGNGKTSIRGNYGIFYDRVVGGTTSDVDGATPGFAQRVTAFPNSVGGASDVRFSDNPALPAQPGSPQLTLPGDRTNALSIWDPNFRSPYVHQFNVTIQREVARNTVVELGYIGNRGVKLLADVNINQRRVYGNFLQSFKEIQANRATGAPVSAGNTLVRIFGSTASAVSAIGGTAIDQGLLATASQTVDQNNYSKYAAAGVSNFYLRNYPQFDSLVLATNGGRSYYNSFQATIRRQAGALKFNASYTLSRTIDNISVDGGGFTNPIDNYNLLLNRARADFDRTHTLIWTATYTLPIGHGKFVGGGMPKWADKIIGGWDIGSLGTWTSGAAMTVSSGRQTGPADTNTWANYGSGDRNIGDVTRKGDGVYFWTPDQLSRFSFPGAGEIGTSGRNAFRGPRYFNTDVSLIKQFRFTETHRVTFRAEAYNLLNNVNFNTPGLSLTTPTTLGKISSTVGNARIIQMALRYDF